VQRALPFPHLTSNPASASRLAGLAQTLAAPTILALGLLLRALLLDRPGLHPDEALYASWALRIADGSDPALSGVYVDKPPLLLYLLAGLFRLAGYDGGAPLEASRLILAGRLAALLTSGASLALLWLIARRIHGPRVALAALALFALSPLAVRLSPTLFTDPWLVLWMLLGLWAALDRRAWLAGIACGLAFATKQQAVLLAPLVLAVLGGSLLRDASADLNMTEAHDRTMAADAAADRGNAGWPRAAWRWLNGFALVAVMVLWWDSLRWQWMPSYWDRSAQTYGGVALALDGSLPQRLGQWGELWGYAFGWPLWLALAVLILWAVVRQVKPSGRPAGAPMEGNSAAQSAPAGVQAKTGPSGVMYSTQRWRSMAVQRHWFDVLTLVYVAGYLALHLLTNLAPWDRYLLPVIPLLALLVGRGAVGAWDILFAAGQPARRTAWQRQIATAALVLGTVYAAYTASLARLPLSDGGAYDGAPAVAAHVGTAEPADAILYHHWLGWHYNFYLYDAPVELRWWQDAADLARKAAASPGQRQLIAFPAGRDDGSVQAALAGAGLHLVPLLTASDTQGAPSATLFSIEPVPSGVAGHAP
jgi:hypothetical protein